MRNDSGGRSGVATARIRLDTSAFERGRQVVVTASRDMQNAVRQASATIKDSTQGINRSINAVADNVKRTQRDIDNFGKSNLGTIAQGFDRAAQSAARLSAAAAVFSGLGIAAANNYNQLNARLLILAGSQERNVELQAELRRIADETGQAYIHVLEGATAILPAVGRANVDLEQTLSLMQRLGVVDPFQGVQGAAFAIRELLSGSIVSLATRFELPRAQLQGLADMAKAGDIQGAVQGLDDLLALQGLTQERFAELQRSGVFAFQRLRGVVQEAMATAFMPLLQNVLLPLATQLSLLLKGIQQTNPALLQTAAGVAVLVAAFAPLNFVLGNVIGMFGRLRALATNPIVLRVGVLGAAAAAGAGLGLNIAQGLADMGIGDQRLRSDSGEDPGKVIMERLGQLVVIIADVLYQLTQAIIEGVYIVNMAFGFVDSILREAILRVAAGLLQVAEWIFSLIPLGGGSAAMQGLAGIRELATTQADTISQDRNVNMAAGQAALEIFRNQVAPQARQVFVDSVRAIFAPQAAVVNDVVEETMSPLQMLAETFTNAQAALQGMNAEIATLTTEYQAEVRQRQESRALAESRAAFDQAIGDARGERDRRLGMSRQDQDFAAQQARQLLEYQDALTEAEAETQTRRLEMLTEFNAETERLIESHGQRILEIERDTRENVLRAARRLRAGDVEDAYRTGARQIDRERTNFSKEQDERARNFEQQLEELVANHEEQQDERRRAYDQQVRDQVAAFNLQRQRQLEDYRIRQADEAFDRAVRRQRQLEDYRVQDALALAQFNEKVMKLKQQIATETGLGQAMLNAIRSPLQVARDGIITFINQIAARAGALGTTPRLAPPPGRIPGSPGTYIPTFAAGGTPPIGIPFWVGEQGPELMTIWQGASIRSNAQSMAGGGGVTIQNFAPVFNDVGSYSPQQLQTLIERSLEQVFREASQAVRRRGL